jgi:hypothetical protein
VDLERRVHGLLRHLVLAADGGDELVERVLKVLLEELERVLVAQIALLLDVSHLHADFLDDRLGRLCRLVEDLEQHLLGNRRKGQLAQDLLLLAPVLVHDHVGGAHEHRRAPDHKHLQLARHDSGSASKRPSQGLYAECVPIATGAPTKS